MEIVSACEEAEEMIFTNAQKASEQGRDLKNKELTSVLHDQLRAMDNFDINYLEPGLPSVSELAQTHKFSIGKLLKKTSIKHTASTSEDERNFLISPTALSQSKQCYRNNSKLYASKSFYLSRVIVPLSVKRTSSMPVSPALVLSQNIEAAYQKQRTDHSPLVFTKDIQSSRSCIANVFDVYAYTQ
ncbi:uncharacterized protein LOC131030759 isoform X2 [Cryptomeria japonica]|uniref:uncharacterized protein LOC131030759 isoform X2 n=1 Tax=Cryptomeria japonica TaxID=3369 RepID=UPI0025AC22CC|nr:uncharacterized protein LOC131030759 isoform X2 [Cryptomeria japonica]